MHDRGSGSHGRKSPDSIGLTRDSVLSKIQGRSNDQKDISVASHLLAPLRQGIPVILEVNDPRIPKRKRVEKPLLFLTPRSVYGVPSRQLVVSLQTHGCEILDSATKIRPVMLMRIGLSSKLAVALANELNLVFKKGEPNGSET